MQKKHAIIAYIPALHKGYLEFIDKHLRPGDELHLINGKEFAILNHPSPVEYLERDVRAIPTEIMFDLLQSYLALKGVEYHVGVLKRFSAIRTWTSDYEKIIMPDDDVTAAILETIPELRERVTLEKMFLRWDKNASLLEKDVKVSAISVDRLPVNVVSELQRQIGKSADWWRQVACVIYDDEGKIILATYNRHLPNDLALNIFGDPRFNFNPGEHIENCTAIHSEAWAIARAAREGISLKGLNMLVSDFPCPVCAKSVAEIGIKNLFYVRGYSKIDGQKTLEDRGITIQKVVFTSE